MLSLSIVTTSRFSFTVRLSFFTCVFDSVFGSPCHVLWRFEFVILWEGLGSPVYPNCIDLETSEIPSYNPEYPGQRPM